MAYLLRRVAAESHADLIELRTELDEWDPARGRGGRRGTDRRFRFFRLVSLA